MVKVYLLYFDFDTCRTYAAVHHGLAYITGALKNKKHSVLLSHLEKENDYSSVRELLRKEAPDVIGLSFTSNQEKYVRRFLEGLSLQKGLIIAGGVHCALVKERVLDNFPQISGICIGEGELPLAELCRRLDGKEDYLTVPSFYFRTDRGIVKNPVAPLNDIESLTFPDYSLFYGNKSFEESGGYHQMLLSRGCPYDCYHCCNHILRTIYPNQEKYVRFPSPSHALKIVKANLAASQKTKLIGFVDDLFTWDQEWLSDFCGLYKKEIGLPFVCCSRVETMKEETASCLRGAGCAVINFGVESGSEWLRNHVMNRRHSNEAIKKAFSIAKRYGIKTHSYNIFGLPLEDNHMQKETIALNLSLRLDSGTCHYFFPFPGTRLYQLCQEQGLLTDGHGENSGYFVGPSLNERYVSHKETKRNFQALQLYFYLRSLFLNMQIPIALNNLIFKMAFLLRGIVFPFCDISTKSALIKKSILLMRRLGIRLMRAA